jgi:hypothetical protein
MAPIAAGAQDYQVCWIFKASGKPPFLRWQTARKFGHAKPLYGKDFSQKIEAALF